MTGTRIAIDLAGAILFMGSAFDTSEVRNGVLTEMSAGIAYLLASRVRNNF